MSEYFLEYIKYDDLVFQFVLELYPSSVITYILSLSYGSGVGLLSSSIPGTISSSLELQNIFMGYAGSVVFRSSHLMYLVIITFLVSGLYNFYISFVCVSAHTTVMALYFLSFI